MTGRPCARQARAKTDSVFMPAPTDTNARKRCAAQVRVAEPRALKQCVQPSSVARPPNCRNLPTTKTKLNANVSPNLEPKCVPNPGTQNGSKFYAYWELILCAGNDKNMSPKLEPLLAPRTGTLFSHWLQQFCARGMPKTCSQNWHRF